MISLSGNLQPGIAALARGVRRSLAGCMNAYNAAGNVVHASSVGRVRAHRHGVITNHHQAVPLSCVNTCEQHGQAMSDRALLLTEPTCFQT